MFLWLQLALVVPEEHLLIAVESGFLVVEVLVVGLGTRIITA
jgi:hypothetical protein